MTFDTDFASIAVSGGASLPIIGALLGHTNSATTQRYAHLHDDPLRAASEAVGSKIAAVFDEKRAISQLDNKAENKLKRENRARDLGIFE